MLTKPTTTLRLAHASEAPPIARMSQLMIEHGLRWRWTPDRVRRAIRDPDTVVLVATVDGAIAGFAIMHFGDERAHLHLLAVDSLCRRQQIGTALIRWLERSCMTAGMREIRLEVRQGNHPAKRFYEQLGFRYAGAIAGYYDRREAAHVYAKRPAG